MIKVTIGNNMHREPVMLPETTTLREALESKEIDYTAGMTSLDGATLNPGDLDKTFAEMGIAEKCFLLNVVKADNAACVKIVGSACVVESEYSLEQIKTLEKYRPGVLSLYADEDGKKTEIFRVCTTKGNGSINAYGVEFGSTPNAQGKAIVTMLVPEGVESAKKWAEDKIGVSILKLAKIERNFDAAALEVEEEKAAVAEAITVL